MFNINYFITVLSNAWDNPMRPFSEEDCIYFDSNTIPFCNFLHANGRTFSPDDFDTILSFIKKSIFNLAHIYISSPDQQDLIVEKSSNLVMIIREVAFYLHGDNLRSFFHLLLKDMLEYPLKSCFEEDFPLLHQFYERSLLLEQVCSSTFYLSSSKYSEETLSSFMKTVRRLPQENIFAFLLYPFDNAYFRSNHRIYPDECTPKELYYAIISGFFSYSRFNNVHTVLMNMIDNTDDDTASTATLNNPIYVLWCIYTAGLLNSIVEFHAQIERMFRH